MRPFWGPDLAHQSCAARLATSTDLRMWRSAGLVSISAVSVRSEMSETCGPRSSGRRRRAQVPEHLLENANLNRAKVLWSRPIRLDGVLRAGSDPQNLGRGQDFPIGWLREVVIVVRGGSRQHREDRTVA